MEKIIERLGEISAPLVKLRESRSKKSELEKIEKPAKDVNVKAWIDQEMAACEQEKKDLAKSIVQASMRDVAGMTNDQNLKDAVRKRLDELPMERRVLILPLVATMLEDTLYATQVDAWEKRTSDVDRAIRGYESRLPPRFSLALVNVNRDYPESRVSLIDGRFCDLWLTKALNSKKPIPFEPYGEWLEKMESAYSVYAEEHRKDQEAKTPAPPPSPVEEKAQPNPEIPPAILAAEFFDLDKERSSGNLRDRIGRIKGGVR